MEHTLTFRSLLAHVVYDRLFAPCAHAPALPVDCGGPAPSSAASAQQRVCHPSGAERRALISRCRLLRSDIRKFEDSFERTNGRKPGSADRSGMAHVYSEYRKLKTLVRGK